MPSLRASVLIISHPASDKIAFGADFADDFAHARQMLSEFPYPVIALPSSAAHASDALDLLEYVSASSPHSQRVIIQNDTPAEILRKIINTGSAFRILGSFVDPRFDLTIEEALEEYRLLQQNVKLLQLVNEQNDRLRKLTGELEERVEARRKSLEETKEKLLMTNHRVEALHHALVAIHRAGSFGEMERLINEALVNALGLSWTRILFQSQARLESQSGGRFGMINESVFALHAAPLMRGKETLGHIYFAREAKLPFTRDENSFLGQIADAIALAIDRLTKLEESESMKRQWEDTFDAILEPVSLIDEAYTIVRINRSFAERSGVEPEKIIGRRCYEALFGRELPCEGCALKQRDRAQTGLRAGINFRLKPARTSGGQNVIYDVFSQELQFKHEDRTLYVNMYHDVSAQLRYERQILESAKMAELGTIGSSIAHELNNPLGGMLSFLQLIKMDLNADNGGGGASHPSYSDIDEMEIGARRCRDIVQSLLGFTRKTPQDSIEVIDMRDVVEQALKITELQTRAMGITVDHEVPLSPVDVRGQFNALAQALRNFLQNAQEAISERRRNPGPTDDASARSKYQGAIKIILSQSLEETTVEISDNGAGFDPHIGDQIYDPMYSTKDADTHPGLGLTVAQQIIRDHGGRLDIHSTKGVGTSAKISFPLATIGHGAAGSSSF